MMISRILLALITSAFLVIFTASAPFASEEQLQFPDESIGWLFAADHYFAGMKPLGVAKGKVKINLKETNYLLLELNEYAASHPEKLFCPDFQKISALGFTKVAHETAWIKKLALFSKYKNLKVLRLDGARITDADMHYITKIPSLEAISLGKTQIKGKNLSQLSSLNLKGLNLGKTYLAPEAFKEISKLKTLDALFIDNVVFEWLVDVKDFREMDRRLAPLLAPLADLKSMKSLNLAGLPVGKKSLKFLSSLKNLNHLRVERSDIDTSTIAELKNLPLTVLNLANCNALDDTTLELVSNHVALLTLKLSWNNRFTEKGLASLAKLKNLRELDLKAVTLKNSKLAFLKGMPGLKILILDDSEITDEAFKRIAGLRDLVCLQVAGSSVSDKSIPIILSLKNLKELHIHDSKISAAGAERIKKGLPACKITGD